MEGVLVVDDNPDTRDAVVTLLQISGYRAVGAPDGRDALAYLKGLGDPSLILLDLRMPVMDGWRFREAQLADASNWVRGRRPVPMGADRGSSR
jgi:CheY-like chemotaxis protein